MVLISHKHKFIYIKNKKVAGSSVESLFGKYCCCDEKSYTYIDKQKPKMDECGIIGSRCYGGKFEIHDHLKAAEIIKKNILDKNKFNNYFKFCVVRNPWDALVSRYFYYIGRCKEKKLKEHIYKIDFKKWIKIFNLEEQNNWNIYTIDDKPICDFYIKYENLKEDIIIVFKKLNIKNYDINNLPNHKTNYRRDKKHYSYYYDEELKDIVYNKFKKEIDYFNYKFEKF